MLISKVIQDTLGEMMSDHDVVIKTKERILQCYYWTIINADILEHGKACYKSQLRKKNLVTSPILFTPLLMPTEPNMRVH
jgi:hypothetical protein